MKEQRLHSRKGRSHGSQEAKAASWTVTLFAQLLCIRLDFSRGLQSDSGMRSIWPFCLVLSLLFSAPCHAYETASPLTDREIIERLTRLEEGQNTLRAEIRANSEAIAQLRADMIAQFARVDAQFTRIDAQFTRIDAQFTRIDGQFAQMQQLLLGIVGAFAAIVAVTIGFAIWDRRSMIRPFESKVKDIEDEISNNRQRLHALFEALRALSLQDQKVAEVLKRFDLL